MNILIVDDNKDLADALAIVLEDEGYNVVVEYSGEGALRRFERMSLDLVLLDVKLPDVNGIEVLRRMRQSRNDFNAVVMTGYRIEQMLSEVIQDGEVVILREPFDFLAWQEAVESAGRDGIVLLVGDENAIERQIHGYLLDMKKNFALFDLESGKGPVLGEGDEWVVIKGGVVLDCVEIYVSLKESGRFGPMAIILPASIDKVDVLRSLRATGCLFKPFDLEYLLNVIK